MAAITDLDDLTAIATGANVETIFWFKYDRVAGAASATAVALRWSSLWLHSGSPGAAVAPTTVAAPDNTTAGGMQQTDPGGGRQKWLIGGGLWASAPVGVMLYDRLLHIGGLDGTSTSAQTVAGTMTRYTSNAACVGNIIFAEIYTAVGSTGTTATCSYTNQAGTAGQVTSATTFGGSGSNGATMFIPFQLASGDTGVQAVASVTLAASTLTAGNFGITVARPLALMGVPVIGTSQIYDWIASGGPPEILTDACLAVAVQDSTTIPRLAGHLHFVEA